MTNSYSENFIEDIILKYSKRGMNILKEYLDVHFCETAARELLEVNKGSVFIATGFYVAGYAETDGPPGAVFLAKALRKIGFRPIIITDHYCEGFFDNELEVVYLPIKPDMDRAVFEDLILQFAPTCMISIERCGRTKENEYLNMRGVSIREHTSPIDMLFVIAKEKNIFTIGIGDGGNEIGMGNLQDIISSRLEVTPCAVTVDRLIIATVSNWGAYGLIACLQGFTGEELIPAFGEMEAFLSKIIGVGSVDGVTKEKTLSVDGFDMNVEREILENLSKAISRLSFNSFTMSEDYSDSSLSQFSIGQKVISLMKEYIAKNNPGSLNILDIGCGPGNLTNEIRKRLEMDHVRITAIDIDENAIRRAKENYKGIRFETQDLYSANTNGNQYDYVFSNETLHWMPKLPEAFYKSEAIIYYFFEEELQAKYREWACNCFRKSFQNIKRHMKTGGIAFLQFGLDGQLRKVYEMVNRIIAENFSDETNLYKLPLYYPTWKELEAICNENGFGVLELINIKEELVEDTPEEIVGFLKGFMENNLCLLLGKEKTAKLFEMIYNELRGMNIREFSENQWNHTIVVLKKQ